MILATLEKTECRVGGGSRKSRGYYSTLNKGGEVWDHHECNKKLGFLTHFGYTDIRMWGKIRTKDKSTNYNSRVAWLRCY